MILYVYVGDVVDAGGVLTFYIPAIIDDGDHWFPLCASDEPLSPDCLYFPSSDL